MAHALNSLKVHLIVQLNRIQQELLDCLSNSTISAEITLAHRLKSHPQTSWVELLEHNVSPDHTALVNELTRVEAALCQFDIGQYGYCADCEEPISLNELKKDPTKQRCGLCER